MPIGVAAEADLNVKRGCFETKAVLFVQHEAPQELLVGTDLQAALGIELRLKEGPEPTLDLEKSDEALVRLLHTTKVPARHEGLVPVSVSGSVHVAERGNL